VHICSNDANTDFFCRHDVFSLLRLMKPYMGGIAGEERVGPVWFDEKPD
jgi:hypothetical protein